MNFDKSHVILMRHLVECDQSEERILAAMLLFHTHRIFFEKSPFEDFPNIRELPAISRSHAAEIVIEYLRDTRNIDVCGTDDWLRRSIEETPYEAAEEIAAKWMFLVEELRLKLLCFPGIFAVEKDV